MADNVVLAGATGNRAHCACFVESRSERRRTYSEWNFGRNETESIGKPWREG